MSLRSSGLHAVGCAATVAAAFACVSCGEPKPAAAAAGSAAPAAAPDLSAVRGCEIVMPAEVVSIAGAAKLATAPTALPAGCLYVVETADGRAESYQFRFDGTGMQRLLIEHLTPEEKMRRIEGPWVDARIGPQPLGGGTRLIVVLGALGIEVTGDRGEPMVEIAKLAATRAP
jgi:hypothetical protein